MHSSTLQQLININQNFYQTTAHQFSESRQFAWPGWQPLLPYIRSSPQTIIDIGCGNGRWCKFLISKNIKINKYYGIDFDQTLLNLAKKSCPYPWANWLEFDITEPSIILDHLKSQPITLIGCFGLLHHLPSFNLRLALINQLIKLLSLNGIISISFWQYHLDPRFNSKVIDWSTNSINPSDLEPNDYLLSWQNNPQALRYVHVFNNQEINKLISKLASVKIINQYKSDGKSNNLNHYVVIQKISS